ncbi:MAG: hypothetical protein ACRCZR_08605 [Cetobacterium sp.]
MLEKNIYILKSTFEKKEKNFEVIQNKNKELGMKKEKKLEENFMFDGSFEVLEYLNKISEENRLIEDTIGRESSEQIQEKKYGSFYYSASGKEKDIFNFILEIEKYEKFISLKTDSILLEVNGEFLDLKLNVMYIINNKNKEIEYFDYKDGMFEKSNNRNIGTKRRKL